MSDGKFSTTADPLVLLRAAGWTVAVHNDYRLGGDAHTFWLLTHVNGRWVKGEGRTDAEAIEQCARQIERYSLDGNLTGPFGTRLDDNGVMTLHFANHTSAAKFHRWMDKELCNAQSR